MFAFLCDICQVSCVTCQVSYFGRENFNTQIFEYSNILNKNCWIFEYSFKHVTFFLIYSNIRSSQFFNIRSSLVFICVICHVSGPSVMSGVFISVICHVSGLTVVSCVFICHVCLSCVFIRVMRPNLCQGIWVASLILALTAMVAMTTMTSFRAMTSLQLLQHSNDSCDTNDSRDVYHFFSWWFFGVRKVH